MARGNDDSNLSLRQNFAPIIPLYKNRPRTRHLYRVRRQSLSFRFPCTPPPLLLTPPPPLLYFCVCPFLALSQTDSPTEYVNPGSGFGDDASGAVMVSEGDRGDQVASGEWPEVRVVETHAREHACSCVVVVPLCRSSSIGCSEAFDRPWLLSTLRRGRSWHVFFFSRPFFLVHPPRSFFFLVFTLRNLSCRQALESGIGVTGADYTSQGGTGGATPSHQEDVRLFDTLRGAAKRCLSLLCCPTSASFLSQMNLLLLRPRAFCSLCFFLLCLSTFPTCLLYCTRPPLGDRWLFVIQPPSRLACDSTTPFPPRSPVVRIHPRADRPKQHL